MEDVSKRQRCKININIKIKIKIKIEIKTMPGSARPRFAPLSSSRSPVTWPQDIDFPFVHSKQRPRPRRLAFLARLAQRSLTDIAFQPGSRDSLTRAAFAFHLETSLPRFSDSRAASLARLADATSDLSTPHSRSACSSSPSSTSPWPKASVFTGELGFCWVSSSTLDGIDASHRIASCSKFMAF